MELPPVEIEQVLTATPSNKLEEEVLLSHRCSVPNRTREGCPCLGTPCRIDCTCRNKRTRQTSEAKLDLGAPASRRNTQTDRRWARGRTKVNALDFDVISVLNGCDMYAAVVADVG